MANRGITRSRVVPRRGVLRANSNTHQTRVSVAIYSEAVPVTYAAVALGYIAVRRATTSFDPLVTLMYELLMQHAGMGNMMSDSNHVMGIFA